MIKYIYIICFACVVFSLQSQDLSVTFNKLEVPCILAEASVTASTTSLPVHYLWSNGGITSSVAELQPGDYSVKVTADNGKDTTIFFKIEELICEPTPETHFTPNFDGYNDTWDISRINSFPEFDLFIYNRWGQQVHRQTSKYFPWDGTSLGLPLPDATYYYILYLDRADKKNFVKGAVSIIR